MEYLDDEESPSEHETRTTRLGDAPQQPPAKSGDYLTMLGVAYYWTWLIRRVIFPLQLSKNSVNHFDVLLVFNCVE